MQRIRKMTAFLLSLILFCSFFSACKPPDEEELHTRDLIWALGAPLPSATDYFEEIPEGYTVSFASEEPYAKLQMGENAIELAYQFEKGRRITVSATLNLIQDTEPPTIMGVADLIAYVGEGVSYRKGITLTDNCDGKLTLEVDSISVDTSKEGIYPVVYTARDHVGNVSTAMVNVHVYAEEITLEMLYEKIDPLIDELGLRNMTREAQARKIYRFVHTDAHIAYVDTSDKTSWIREAYFTLETRKGDCFSYFSLSKAFFERLEIENMDIQRLPGYTDDTHYWSLINVGLDGGTDEWYHYDATRLRDITFDGSLLTDAQIQAFTNHVRKYFYLYDTSAYPASASTILTPRPDLDPYL